jgi:hypothetical protein
MTARRLGCINTPAQASRIPPAAVWAADNGCFGAGYPGDVKYLAWLARHQPDAGRCVFAVAPDVPFDMASTLARSRPFLPVIRGLGYPVALAAQSGLENMTVPWDDIDALFIGGDTAWKLSPAAAWLCREARRRGKHVHMGRVNSLRRVRMAWGMGCDSADGTYLAFGPDVNLPRLLGWLEDLERNGAQMVI